MNFQEALDVLKELGEISGYNKNTNGKIKFGTSETSAGTKEESSGETLETSVSNSKTDNITAHEVPTFSEETCSSSTDEENDILRFNNSGNLIANRSVANDEKLGYTPGVYYYNHSTRCLYSKNIYLENKSADYMEEKKKIMRSIMTDELERTITYWQERIKKPGFKYHSYTEVDMQSPIYKMLAACSQVVCGTRPEYVIRYMIEGKLTT